MLDFGCGTGLLAIAAVKMRAERAPYVDIVQETARRARRNVELNELSEKITIKWGGWDQVHQRYDLIFAKRFIVSFHLRIHLFPALMAK